MRSFLLAASLLLTPALAAAAPEQCLRGKVSSAQCKQVLHNYWAHEAMITKVALHYGLEPALLKALVAVESGFNPNARSSANALGLTQVLPSTAKDVGLHNPEVNLFQPELALAAGAAYLRQMWFEFGDWEIALAAYNAGPGAVRKHKGIPPYAETRKYVPLVLKLYREFAAIEAHSSK